LRPSTARDEDRRSSGGTTRDDAGALVALSLEGSAYQPSSRPSSSSRATRVASRTGSRASGTTRPETLALVAELDGTVVGYVEAVVQEPETWRRF